jgi:hypothetical protein
VALANDVARVVKAQTLQWVQHLEPLKCRQVQGKYFNELLGSFAWRGSSATIDEAIKKGRLRGLFAWSE